MKFKCKICLKSVGADTSDISKISNSQGVNDLSRIHSLYFFTITSIAIPSKLLELIKLVPNVVHTLSIAEKIWRSSWYTGNKKYQCESGNFRRNEKWKVKVVDTRGTWGRFWWTQGHQLTILYFIKLETLIEDYLNKVNVYVNECWSLKVEDTLDESECYDRYRI